MNTAPFLAAALLALAGTAQAGRALCPPVAPALGSAVRDTAPVFPADHWWNLDVSAAPVDANSAAYIAFINNGGRRRLHPDFGGTESPGSVAIYGMPYAVVDGTQPKLAVDFLYADESDGVDPATGRGLPFYPIPTQAVTQPHWVEGGAPASQDQRATSDRHLLMLDCTNNHLYELYNVFFDGSRWHAGSGAFFDMNTNARRPAGWTSADAAGLAIFPGLVRHDEVYNPAVAEIGHAFRVTVRATNGAVWPASHRAGSTPGALPMGARLRLKPLVGGLDPALRSPDPGVRKIFRAMQKHGLIVADNGSDMYVTGTFDTRWNNGVLNPAFALLAADDFEVVQLGWNPVAAAPGLATLTLSPARLTGGALAQGTVQLDAAAPAGGATVTLATDSAAARAPASVTIAAGARSASFAVTSFAVSATTTVRVSASYAGVTRSAPLQVDPRAALPALVGLTITPTLVISGSRAQGRVTLGGAAPAGGVVVRLSSTLPALAAVPASVRVAAGARSTGFIVSTGPTSTARNVQISAQLETRQIAADITVAPR